MLVLCCCLFQTASQKLIATKTISDLSQASYDPAKQKEDEEKSSDSYVSGSDSSESSDSSDDEDEVKVITG